MVPPSSVILNLLLSLADEMAATVDVSITTMSLIVLLVQVLHASQDAIIFSLVVLKILPFPPPAQIVGVTPESSMHLSSTVVNAVT